MMPEKLRLVSLRNTVALEHMTAQSVFCKRETIVQIEQMEMRERQVFCLIDGKRSLESIAGILHLTHQETALYAARLLVFHRAIELAPMSQSRNNGFA